MTNLPPQLVAELKKAWQGATSSRQPDALGFGDAAARAEVLYDVVRVLYDEAKFDRPPSAPGEVMSIGEVTDAAMSHIRRAGRAVTGEEFTIDPLEVDHPAAD